MGFFVCGMLGRFDYGAGYIIAINYWFGFDNGTYD